MADIAVGDDELNLALDRDAIETHLKGLFAHDFDKAHRVYRKDAILKRPQFGETIVGRDSIKMDRLNHPERKLLTVDFTVGQDDLWVAESVFEVSGKRTLVVNLMEFSNGQIVCEREYFCPLF
jgi:hypothetical protein